MLSTMGRVQCVVLSREYMSIIRREGTSLSLVEA